MSINEVVYRGDDPAWAAQVEKTLTEILAAQLTISSQLAFLKGSTR